MQNYEEDLAISLDTQRLEEVPIYKKVGIETLP
jgi:stress response protein YsnF